MDLTEAARAGYRASREACDAENPHLATSPNAYAWTVGAHMARTGRCEPSDVRMGRGARVRVRDMVFAVAASGEITRER